MGNDQVKALLEIARFHDVDIRRFQLWAHNSYDRAVWRQPPFPKLDSEDEKVEGLLEEPLNEGHSRRIAQEIISKMRYGADRIKLLNGFALDVKKGGVRDRTIRRMHHELQDANIPLVFLCGFWRIKPHAAAYPEWLLHRVITRLSGYTERGSLPDYARVIEQWQGNFVARNKIELLDALAMG